MLLGDGEGWSELLLDDGDHKLKLKYVTESVRMEQRVTGSVCDSVKRKPAWRVRSLLRAGVSPARARAGGSQVCNRVGWAEGAEQQTEGTLGT